MNDIQTAYGQFRSAMAAKHNPDWPTIKTLLPLFEGHDIAHTVARIIDSHHQPFVDPFTVSEHHSCKMWAKSTLSNAGLPYKGAKKIRIFDLIENL